MRTQSNHLVAGTRMRVVALVAAIAVVLGVLASPAAGRVRNETPKATEVGVSDTEIHIAVIADVDNPVIPNVLIGARDAVKASPSTSTRAAPPRTSAWPVASSWSTSTTRISTPTTPATARSRRAATTSPWSGPPRCC